MMKAVPVLVHVVLRTECRFKITYIKYMAPAFGSDNHNDIFLHVQ